MIRLRNTIVDFYENHKRGLVIAVVAVCSGWFILKGIMQIPTIEQNRARIAEYETKITEEKERQAEIDDLATKVNTDEYIERIASEKLGLVKSNATIFYDVSDED